MVYDVTQVGFVAPPEDPELLGIRFKSASPHTQQVGLHAACKAAQHRVILCWCRDHGSVFAAATEVVAAPFDARQLRLPETKRKRLQIRKKRRRSSFTQQNNNIYNVQRIFKGQDMFLQLQIFFFTWLSLKQRFWDLHRTTTPRLHSSQSFSFEFSCVLVY